KVNRETDRIRTAPRVGADGDDQGRRERIGRRRRLILLSVETLGVSRCPLSCQRARHRASSGKPMPFPKASVLKPWMLLLLLAVSGARIIHAQLAPLSQPVPFLPGVPKPAPGPASNLEISAFRALNLGLSSIAADLYRKIFDDPATSADVRNRVAVNLATALIEEDRLVEASQVLKKYSGLPTSGVHLRLAMIAVRERRYDAARTGSAGGHSRPAVHAL
ncbi:MAG: hypothetical protein QM760_01670, partial [Nibricoccus sp.]